MEIEIKKVKYKVKYRHERVKDVQKGGKTKASIELKGKLIQGIAYCSEHDQFNKKLGRMIALGRLKKLVL